MERRGFIGSLFGFISGLAFWKNTETAAEVGTEWVSVTCRANDEMPIVNFLGDKIFSRRTKEQAEYDLRVCHAAGVSDAEILDGMWCIRRVPLTDDLADLGCRRPYVFLSPSTILADAFWVAEHSGLKWHVGAHVGGYRAACTKYVAGTAEFLGGPIYTPAASPLCIKPEMAICEMLLAAKNGKPLSEIC